MKHLVVAVFALSAGCSGFIQRQAADSTYAILQKSQVAARRQSDVQLAREALPGGIVQLDAFALAYPDHRGFRVMHAEALCQYVTAFVFDDWEDASLAKRPDAERLARRVENLLGQCVEANLALLPEPWRKARNAGADAWSAQLATATRAELDALRWLAMSDSLLLALDPIRRLPTLPIMQKTLERVIELAPGSHESDAELVLGTLQAGTSKYFHGPDGSQLFDRARKQQGPGALMVEVMFARAVAVAKSDRALFTATLQRVLDADLAAWPELRLANELAQIKARRYLAAIDQLIPQ